MRHAGWARKPLSVISDALQPSVTVHTQALQPPTAQNTKRKRDVSCGFGAEQTCTLAAVFTAKKTHNRRIGVDKIDARGAERVRKQARCATRPLGANLEL